jgi:peptidoglycan/LPS O-acetylase OafA/YrhL
MIASVGEASARLFRDSIRLGRVPELDGLRALLAWWVVIYHAGGATFANAFSVSFGPLAILRQGSLAVDAFMMLSGFVIFFLLDREDEGYRAFLTRRFLRLFPVFGLCLAVMLFLQDAYVDNLRVNALRGDTELFAQLVADALQQWREIVPQLAVHAALLHGAVPDGVLRKAAGAFLMPAWSISLEWQFYLIAPLVFRLVRSLGAAGAAVWGLVTIACFATREWWPSFSFHAFLPLQLHCFTAGIASYYGLKWIATRPDRPRWLGWGPVAVVASTLALVAVQTARLGLARGTTPGHWFPFAVWALVFAAVLARDADSALGSAIRRMLRFPPLERLGVASYSTYLVHWPVLVGCQALFRRLLDATSPWPLLGLHVMVSFPLIAAASFALHRFVEEPGIALGRRLARRLAARA